MSLSLGTVLPVIAAAAAVASALGGVVLVAVGLRGRRVDDHTLCRRCRHDLTGMPTTSDRCPECGADVRQPRATVIGHRRRRGGMIVIGVALLVIVLTPSVIVTSFVMRGADWRSRVPTWYELAEARGTLPTSPSLAIGQLIARDAAGRLDVDQRRRLADAILAMQKETRTAWNVAWGDWIGARILDGSLPPQQRDAFFANLVARLRFDVRSRVRHGDSIALAWSKTPMRGLMRPAVKRFEIHMNPETDRQFWIDGRQVPFDPQSHEFAIDFTTSSTGQTDSKNVPRERLLPGEHVVEWRDQMHIVFATQGATDGEEMLVVPSVRRATITVEPPDATGVRLINDEALRPQMAAAIKVASVSLGTATSSSMLWMNYAAPLPVGVAFDVVLKQGGREYQVTKITRRPSDPASQHGYGFSFFERVLPTTGKAEIILRPSLDAARNTVDLFEIWGGELHFADVDVK